MNNRYVYQQFGVWWVFAESALAQPIHLSGPYPTRDAAEKALDLAWPSPVRAVQAAH